MTSYLKFHQFLVFRVFRGLSHSQLPSSGRAEGKGIETCVKTHDFVFQMLDWDIMKICLTVSRRLTSSRAG